MSAIKSAAFSRSARIGAVVAVAGAALVAGAPASFAVASAVTSSANSGPSGGGNTITLTATTAVFTAGSVVEFQYSATATAPVGTTCTANYATPTAVTATAGVVAVASPKILSSTKMAVTIPAGVAIPGGGPASMNFAVCVYPGTSTTTSAVTAYSKAKYAIAAAPTASAVSPAGAPALGGGTITVTGTNFITGATSATLGGQPVTGLTVLNSTSFTGTVPAHAAGPVTLSVTTTGGTVNKANFFTYSDGLIISPATAPTNGLAPVDLDIQGVGFADKNFTTTTGTKSSDGNAHVYLVRGAYDATLVDADSDPLTADVKTNPQAAECTNVLVISDSELICSLDTAGSIVAAEANKFSRAVTNGVLNSTVTVTSATAQFDSDDLGRTVTGTGIPAGAVIATINSATSVDLDQAATATASSVALTIGADNAVSTTDTPNGTYTITVVSDGRPGATATAAQARTNTAYTASIISSGSTFTVAPY